MGKATVKAAPVLEPEQQTETVAEPKPATTTTARSIFSPEQQKELLTLLSEPFELEVISWKPQVTTYKDPENPKAKGAAYADQRAYTDRLNELFGPNGWTRQYSVHVASGMDRVVTVRGEGGHREDKIIGNQAKVFVVATVTIYGIGAHTGTGEAWIDDDNAFTSAEAQAFKRACVCFGLGRYLYDLPETEWLPIDKFTKQFKVPPVLPEWALPSKKTCKDCGNAILARTVNRVSYSAGDLAKRGRELYGAELCADCQIERARTKHAS